MSAITMFGACRSVKEKEYKHDQEALSRDVAVASRSLLLWNSTDSTVRYWHYLGDTAFYFHPDSGLYASRGQLQMHDYRTGRVSAYRHRDSTLSRKTAANTSHTEKEYHLSPGPRREWLFGAITLLLIIVLVRRTVRKYR